MTSTQYGQVMGYTEDAAHMLVLLEPAGLALSAPDRSAVLVGRLADHLAATAKTKPPSHIDTARNILDDVEAQGLVKVRPERRSRVMAMLGTFVGNVASRKAGSA